MPGTGHSGRYKGSISNRNTKSSFQVLAPWNAKKNGEKNQVAVSTGGNNLNFKLMGAKMMSNYHKDGDNFILDCSLTVLGNKIVTGDVIIDGDVDICGNVTIDKTLDVKEKATFNDVDICGNLNANTGTFNGTLTNTYDVSGEGIVTKYLTVTNYANINLGAVNHLIDVCDNILTLGNHEPVNHEEMRGILARYAPQTGSADKYAFFGFDPSGLEGPTNDPSGSFVFFIDASSAILGAANETQGIAGRGVFGAIDISGGARYGGAVNNISGQADSAMVLVGRTIIATAGGTSAKLDISGGIDVVGPSKLTDLSGALIDISGGQVTLDGALGVNIEGGSNSNFTTTSGDIQIIGAQGVAINSTTNHVAITGADNVNIAALTNINIGGGATTVDISGATSVDISGGTTTLDAGGTLNIGPICQNIAIGNSSATVDISGSTVDISGGTHVNLTDGSGANINIASGLIHLDVNSTILGQTLGQIKLTDGSGAYIDMRGGKIDISGDHVTITGGPTSISLKSQTINIGEAGGTVDIKGNVKVDDAVTFVVKDISATNIDVSGALTVNGGTIDMSGTNTVVGKNALHSTIGDGNVAVGYQALQSNTIGDGNVAVGYRALESNTIGDGNVAVGYRALPSNTIGDENVAFGQNSLESNTTGMWNVATGTSALYSNISGGNNIASGWNALVDNDASYNVAIGSRAGNGQTDISNTINVGYDASCNASNTACIGNADISCVYLGSTSGLAKLDCSGIVSSGLVETTDISCSMISAGGNVGSVNQILSQNAGGIIEWVDGTTVGSHWITDTGPGIHNTSGNVGINKDSSNNVALDVSGNMAINGTINTLTVGFGGGDISTNTVVGYQALMSNTSGGDNVAIGYQALYTNDSSFNVATGAQALYSNQSGSFNVATGVNALSLNISGDYNVATGTQALSSNISGDHNVATGTQALYSNQSGKLNVATGASALYKNTSGDNNVAAGPGALWSNISGDNNVATGASALYDNSGGSNNVATGYQALYDNSGGSNNVATGYRALYSNIDGSNNTAIGNRAGFSNLTGSNNTFLGNGADASDNSGNISNSIILGNGAIAHLQCFQQSITALSDERDKKNIIDIPYGLELINNLQPRQFTWDMRGETDDNPNQGTTRVGFIAQEVQTALGENNTVLNMVDGSNPEKLQLSYGQLVPVLTKAVQELNKQLTAEKGKTTILESKITAMEARLAALE